MVPMAFLLSGTDFSPLSAPSGMQYEDKEIPGERTLGIVDRRRTETDAP